MLKKSDFRFDTFKFFDGKTELNKSGVRVKHLPTGLKADSTLERSQIRNQRVALERLLKQDQMVSWMAIEIINDSMEEAEE